MFQNVLYTMFKGAPIPKFLPRDLVWLAVLKWLDFPIETNYLMRSLEN